MRDFVDRWSTSTIIFLSISISISDSPSGVRPRALQLEPSGTSGTDSPAERAGEEREYGLSVISTWKSIPVDGSQFSMFHHCAVMIRLFAAKIAL